MRANKSHKIRTDTGIEIIVPSDFFNNSEYIEFIQLPMLMAAHAIGYGKQTARFIDIITVFIIFSQSNTAAGGSAQRDYGHDADSGYY